MRQKYRCKLKLCHLFICGLYFMYLYIILRQRIEDFICYKSAPWLNQSCDKKIRGDELSQLHSFASRSCRLQLPSITNTIWDIVILKIWKVIYTMERDWPKTEWAITSNLAWTSQMLAYMSFSHTQLKVSVRSLYVWILLLRAHRLVKTSYLVFKQHFFCFHDISSFQTPLIGCPTVVLYTDTSTFPLW